MTRKIIPHSIALIPCRGGSKGIPRKNLQEVGGIPLIARTILTAQNAGIERVIVSTDDPEISELASAYSVELIQRPDEISTDTSTTQEVIDHVCRQINDSVGTTRAPFFLLQATSPFLKSNTLVSMFEQSDFSSPFLKITTFPWHGILWKAIDSEDSQLFPVEHSREVRLRRQDMQITFSETGAAYLSRFGDELDSNVRKQRNVYGHETSFMESLQIDTPADLDFCRSISIVADA